MSDVLLQLADLACERDGRMLFRNLSLSVRAGQCVELTGPNGSGKSTLLRCLAGLYPDFTGVVTSEPMMFVGHRPGISQLLSPLENLSWYQRLLGDSCDLLQIIDEVGLRGYEHVRCQNLSAGQQRRVALARLQLARRPLWLLDEPFTALDSAGLSLVRGLISRQVSAGGAVLCATHQPLELPALVSLRLGEAA